MTARSRPNLGALFDGRTPADRPSSIAGKLADQPAATPVPERSAAHRAAIQWWDPTKAVELYFGALQAALDAHHEFARGLAKASSSFVQLPHGQQGALPGTSAPTDQDVEHPS